MLSHRYLGLILQSLKDKSILHQCPTLTPKCKTGQVYGKFGNFGHKHGKRHQFRCSVLNNQVTDDESNHNMAEHKNDKFLLTERENTEESTISQAHSGDMPAGTDISDSRVGADSDGGLRETEPVGDNTGKEDQSSADTAVKLENRPTKPENQQASGYIPPIEDPYNKALKYLEKHNILQLFQNMTAGIVYKKPDDPLCFMADEIETVQELERHRNFKIKRKSPSSEETNTDKANGEVSSMDT